MKYIYKLILATVSVALLLTACSPDDPQLGSLIPQDQLDFNLSLNPENSNEVIIKSNNPDNIVYWTWDNEAASSAGHSTTHLDTLSFGFAGNYIFNYSIASRGGVVTAEPKIIKIETYQLEYMDNPLWQYLTGGAGHEKVWQLDLDANGKSVYFSGPLYFYGTNDSWESVTEGKDVGGDSWNWSPDYPGNSWLMPKADYGTLVFGAVTGHTLVSDRKIEGVTSSGAYWMDVNNHTLTTTNTVILRDQGRIAIVTKWESLKILSLTENSMQLGVIRDNDPKEGPCLLVYNFVSKDYYDKHK